MTKLRVGIVDYLNSRPLAWGFLEGRCPDSCAASFLSPAEVARRLAAGELDVGLVPSIELQRIPDLEVIPGLCVAAREEVRSVLLLLAKPVEQVRRVALDENSRTSAALVRILMHDVWGLSPELVTAPPDPAAMLATSDAALVIGDPALRVDRSAVSVLDLAAEWRRLTGRPFVFAVWAVRAGVDLGDVRDVFRRGLEDAMADLDPLVEAAASELDLPAPEIRHYLTRNLGFTLGPEELAGLEEFFHRAHRLGLIPPPKPLVLR